ncbi:unnamed protein product [Bursaphelenchus xylophilus]|uniref:tRNA-dihydrouridine synthase n=1 Tax=Bursaphelenchus xylophilus TaxID=6326 RepID=A0A1I7STZ7_BURXY|nr:unnamed protein product [Bursaphelenchus xylophilus]CAG9107759.1 unnamed protein product [Bursaphelenchus xylophilus]
MAIEDTGNPPASASCSTDSESEYSEIRRRIVVNKDEDCKKLGIDPPLFICAPMVRYSKLHFRRLVSLYGCELAYTPMIYAHCFVASEKCRANEFTTDEGDWPIVQFAANKPEDFARAAELVYGDVKGIDLNCGCPKSDVRSEGFGSKMLENPELISDIVKQTRNRISDPDFTISVKIRIRHPLSETVDMCRKFESAGVSHIAVHGRTVSQRAESPDFEAIGHVKASVQVPVYANGGCTSYRQALEIASITGADGIMVGEGLLSNPALFGGHQKTPVDCIKDWFSIATDMDVHYTLLHRHTAFMSNSLFTKSQRMELQKQNSVTDVINFVREQLSGF